MPDVFLATVLVYTSADTYVLLEIISIRHCGPEIERGFNNTVSFINTVATGSTAMGLGKILVDLRALFSKG